MNTPAPVSRRASSSHVAFAFGDSSGTHSAQNRSRAVSRMAEEQPCLRSATFQSCGASVRAGDDPTFMSKPDRPAECHNCLWCGYPLTERGFLFDELREVLVARGVDIEGVLRDAAARMPIANPKHIPVARDMRSRADGRMILTRGSACSHACVLAHIIHGNAANVEHARAFAVEAAVLEGCGLDDIVPAPPREALLRNGGDMSFGAFRSAASSPAQQQPHLRVQQQRIDLITSPVYEHCPHSFEKRFVGDERVYEDLFASVLTTDGTTRQMQGAAASADPPKRAVPRRKKTIAHTHDDATAPPPPPPEPTPAAADSATAAKRKKAHIDAYFVRQPTL